MGQLYHGTAGPIGPVHQAECTLPPVVSALSKLGTGLAATFCAKFSRFSWTISFLHILCVLVTSNFLHFGIFLQFWRRWDRSKTWANLISCVSVSDGLSRSLMTWVLLVLVLSIISSTVLSCYWGGASRLTRLSEDLLGLVLVGKGFAGKGTFPGWEWGSGLISLNTPGVPFPNPIMSNIIMCRKNSPTLEQDAQNGPHVFLPPLQQAGYPPPKQSPIPSTCSRRQVSWMATTRATTSFVDSILVGWMWEESSR